MMLFAAALASIGFAGLLYKRSILGVLISMQIMFMGAATALVSAGAASGAGAQTHVFALLVVCACVAQGLAAYSVAVRAFYLRGRANMDDMKAQNHE